MTTRFDPSADRPPRRTFIERVSDLLMALGWARLLG